MNASPGIGGFVQAFAASETPLFSNQYLPRGELYLLVVLPPSSSRFPFPSLPFLFPFFFFRSPTAIYIFCDLLRFSSCCSRRVCLACCLETSQLPSLRRLDLAGLVKVDDEVLKALAATLSLSRVDLSRYKQGLFDSHPNPHASTQARRKTLPSVTGGDRSSQARLVGRIQRAGVAYMCKAAPIYMFGF